MNNQIDKLVTSTVGQLNGYYRDSVFVGGSYAAHKILYPQLAYEDVDIFVLTPKSMDTWAVRNILCLIFDVVTEQTFTIGKYKIAFQYKRFICIKDGVKFDLIFMDTTLHGLVESTGSYLSQLYLKYSQGLEDECLRPLDDNQCCKAVDSLVMYRRCKIFKTQCTDDHIQKIMNRCQQLNLEWY